MAIQAGTNKVPASIVPPLVESERLGFEDTSEVGPLTETNDRGILRTVQETRTDRQRGVDIPSRQGKHLALRRDVVEAVEAGQFVVYALGTVEEAIGLMTGVSAGE